ncbi:hypothetical protein BGZ99_000335 [Dissophora globulifera]|uniref:Major facilitator superfamily (MFS) profile domain-containing protein n=1 Tax=Dissophora globulifera TaxID=979702 RepID=A0A9P6R5D9_9FUNG|nr:hypothetical protein BGZ99_000335 [Dissophora globulifera]
MAQLLDIINISSITITLPDIQRDVGYKVDQLQWVSSAYALSYGAFLLTGGRFGDLFGHRLIFIVGATWFSIWALINGFAKDPIVMSVGRALQGVGAGFTVPSALAILTTSYPVGPERNQALAIFGGTAALGSVLGVLLGGILGSYIGWRWIFYITAIIGFLMAFLGFLIIPAEKSGSANIDRRIDYIGITSFTLGIVGVIYYLSEGPSAGWVSAQTFAPLLVSIALIEVFLYVQSVIDYPIMPFHIWRSRRLVSSCIIVMCVSAGLNSMIFFTSLTFQNVQNYTPLHTALTYLVHGIGAIVTIVGMTSLVTRVRTKVVMTVGWFFFIGSNILFAQIKPESSYWSIAFPAFILNFMGVGPLWLCCQVNSVADADDKDQGVVGAFYNVALQLGGPIGVAVSNIIANGQNGPTAVGVELLPGYHAAFYTCAIIGGVGLIVTVLIAANQDIKYEENTSSGVAGGSEGEELGMDAVSHAEGMKTARNSQILEPTKDYYQYTPRSNNNTGVTKRIAAMAKGKTLVTEELTLVDAAFDNRSSISLSHTSETTTVK